LRTCVAVTAPGCDPVDFTREYTLVAGEPFVRLTTTGAACQINPSSGYSVMVRFPLASKVATIAHGTLGHWTDVQPWALWDPPVFRATHDFVLPRDGKGDTLAAVYHGGTPAWAFTQDGALIGCILRDTPGNDQYGADGSDTGVHTHSYALRVPRGLGGPETGQPRREALRFATPPAVAWAAGGSHRTGSLASVSEPAIITVAKPGAFDPSSLILRIYQPTNKGITATVALDTAPSPVEATIVTALEKEWPGPAMQLTPTSSGFSLQMPAAWASVKVEGMGSP
jgi:alpha-mannosidase